MLNIIDLSMLNIYWKHTLRATKIQIYSEKKNHIKGKRITNESTKIRIK